VSRPARLDPRPRAPRVEGGRTYGTGQPVPE
jgi:hypothetical protein